MPRVLQVGKYFAPFRGGIENYLRDAMVALDDLGVESMAVVHDHQPSVRSSEGIVISGGRHLRLVRVATWFSLAFTPISPSFPWWLQRSLGRFQPDLVHAHCPNPSAMWLLLSPRARRIPWVVHWHADVVASPHDGRLRWLYPLFRPFERRLLKRAAVIVATSRRYLECSEPLKPFLDKCRVVPLGLPDWPDHPAETQDQDVRPLRVLAIGRLTYYKGFGHLVRATARAGDGVTLDIIGGGELEQALARAVERSGASDQITLHGHCSDEKVREHLARCDCVCLPSIERTEAFGMVLLEAMRAGKATLISDVPGSGMGWVVEKDVTGIKVEPGDEAALARALQQLRDDRPACAEMGRRGRERFEQLFTIEASARGLVEVYQQALSGGGMET